MGSPVDFTVFVLTYGDHFELARRCLQSVADTEPDRYYVKRIVLLSNAATEREELDKLLRSFDIPAEIEVLHYASDTNNLKYPMMRQAFYDPEHPIKTSHVMWFDDDSYIETIQLGATNFWGDVARTLLTGTPDRPAVVGSLYRMALRGQQHKGIMAQKWYNAKGPIGYGELIHFCTGGWWAADYSFLSRYDYPFPELKHNGGDVMLGALASQTNHKLGSYRPLFLCINADEDGRESKAPRRGITQPPLWYDYDPTVIVDTRHHDFRIIPYDPRHQAGEPA